MLSLRRRERSSQFSDREQAYALALIMVGIVLVTVAIVAILMENAARESAQRMLGPGSIVGPTPDRSGPPPSLDVTEYVNGTHDYGFAYPTSWIVRENAQITSLENPSGRIRVLFGIGPSGDLEAAASRSIDSLSDVTSNRDVIGMTRERIDGSSSLLVSGTAVDQEGRRVRFLAITVRGDSKNYAISILVPRRSDPIMVLPQIEEIVSSFDALATGAGIST